MSPPFGFPAGQLPPPPPFRSPTFFLTVKHTNVSAFVILIYDYLETLEAEVDLIWGTKWRSGKVLFLLARYPTLIQMAVATYYSSRNIPDNTCNHIFAFMCATSIFGIAAAQAILVLRTCALFGNNRQFLAFLSAMYIGSTIASIIISVEFYQNVELDNSPGVVPGSCFIRPRSKILFYDFVILMFSETVTMILMLWIGFKKQLFISPGKLVTVIYRDGIFYYVYLFLIALTNLIMYAVAPPPLSGLFSIYQPVMHSIISTRILLHVRNVAAQNRVLASDFALDIRFQDSSLDPGEVPPRSAS